LIEVVAERAATSGIASERKNLIRSAVRRYSLVVATGSAGAENAQAENAQAAIGLALVVAAEMAVPVEGCPLRLSAKAEGP